MSAESVKTIRALQRGIEVWRTLDGNHAVALEDIHKSTGIPKATLSRILKTLEAEGLATQRLLDKKWLHVAPARARQRRNAEQTRLVQAAAPALSQLCDKILWPSDLSVRSGLSMTLVETSRPNTTLLFNKLAAGFKIDFLLSAPGRAYLAFCPDAERKDILAKLSKCEEYRPFFEHNRIEMILATVRKNGFGHRDSNWGGKSHFFRKDSDDGLDAIAVPIRLENNVIGCVNVVWIRSVLSRNEAVSKYLEDLQRTARLISVAFAK